MALAYKRGGKRGLKFALNQDNRDLFREKLSVLKLGLENRLTDRMGLLWWSTSSRKFAYGIIAAL